MGPNSLGFSRLVCGAILFLCTDAQMVMGHSVEESLSLAEEIAETRSYSLGLPLQLTPSPDGKSVLFLRSGPRDTVLRLYVLDSGNGQVGELLSPEELLGGVPEELDPEEKARRERQRMTLGGFTFFELSRDASRVLVSLSGRLFVFRMADRSVIKLPELDDPWIDPRFSPDGRYVAAASGQELYVYDLEDGRLSRLTSGATDTKHHGVAEFVAQEEMGRYEGYWWSPDSQFLAFQETDLSRVEKLYVMAPGRPEQEPYSFRYPRAGTDNALVRLGIVRRSGGDITWVHWDSTAFPYLARVGWQAGSPLTLVVQSRSQKEEQLLSVDPTTGSTRTLFIEKDDAWLNLDEGQNRKSMPFWLSDGSGFIWNTERRGQWQLELRDSEGGLVRELTPAHLNVHQLVDVDERAGVLVAAGGPDPRERHLFRVKLKGGKLEQLSQGTGIHSAVFSANHGVFVHQYVLSDGTRETQVRRKNGKILARIPSAAQPPPFLPNMELTRAKGEREYDAILIRPRDFDDTKRYPVLVYVYGGPGHKTVLSNPCTYMREQWMADHGYVVVSIDGRGTPGHGREWERAIRGNLIDAVLSDQIDGLKALGATYPALDLERVGITGWSFGGYVSAMAVVRHPDVYRVGVSGAPVTDWLDYDTHYTERYLGLPSENPTGYAESSILTYADQLRRPLMLIHGLTDDNVLFVHTLKLVERFFLAGCPYDMMPLAGTHLLPDPMSKLRLWTRTIDYFNEHSGLPLQYPPPLPDIHSQTEPAPTDGR